MFQELIARIAASLKVRKIPYMIIGGQAVLLYGEPRLTRDIDVTIGADVSRLPDVLRSAGDIGVTPLPDDAEVDSTYIRQWLSRFDESVDDGSFTETFEKILSEM